jgi:hypothetical protein
MSTPVDEKSQTGAGAPAPSAEEFDSLVRDILQNPEKILTAPLTEEQLVELQRRVNPYKPLADLPAPVDGKVLTAAVSYTNLREDYLKRFVTTGITGFLFQVAEEHETPGALRRWTPQSAAAKKKASEDQSAPYDPDQLISALEAVLAIAREAKNAKVALEEQRTRLAVAQMPAARGRGDGDLKLSDAERAATDDPRLASLRGGASLAAEEAATKLAAGKAAALLYTATYSAHQLGLGAGARLYRASLACMPHPEVREVITRYPLPPPPDQVEAPPAVAKAIINQFLRHWLVFDPSIHVRSGHDAKALQADVAAELLANGEIALADRKDPERLPLAALLAAPPRPAAAHAEAVSAITASERTYNAVVGLLRDPALAAAARVALGDVAAFKRYLLPVAAADPAAAAARAIPPQDTFHRLNYYMEVNYEKLRTITQTLYDERPDLDWLLAIWKTFEGTEAVVNEQFDKFCQVHQDDLRAPIKQIRLGAWTFLGDFARNRENINFYNKNTDVLKRILDRHGEDRTIGAELMRKRVHVEKARNIAENGPDAKGLGSYKMSQAADGRDLASQGVAPAISREQMLRLERAKGDLKAARELELLDQLEATIARLKELARTRALTTEETQELATAEADATRAREMVAVPDDAIQVDVFSTNARDGTISKSNFYTAAETQKEIADRQAAAASAWKELEGPRRKGDGNGKGGARSQQSAAPPQ